MPLFAPVMLAVTLFLILTISAMALCAKLMGIEIRRITYGLGPTIFVRGKVEIRALPLSGRVQLKDSRVELLELTKQPTLSTTSRFGSKSRCGVETGSLGFASDKRLQFFPGNHEFNEMGTPHRDMGRRPASLACCAAILLWAGWIIALVYYASN